MATIDIRRNHDVGKAAAREAAEGVAMRLREKIDVRYHWDGDVIILERTGASGRFEVGDDAVHVKIELGFALRPLKGMVTQRVHDYLDEAFPA